MGFWHPSFGLFHTQINLKLHNIDSVVMAWCVLHNFLMKSVTNCYAFPECFDRDNTEEGTSYFGFQTFVYMERLEREYSKILQVMPNVSEKQSNSVANQFHY